MTRRTRWLAVLLAGWLTFTLVAPAQAQPRSYTNDISAPFADTYAEHQKNVEEYRAWLREQDG